MHFLHEADTGGESHVVVLEIVRPMASVQVDFFGVDLHFLWGKERYQHGWLFGMGILGNIDSNYIIWYLIYPFLRTQQTSRSSTIYHLPSPATLSRKQNAARSSHKESHILRQYLYSIHIYGVHLPVNLG